MAIAAVVPGNVVDSATFGNPVANALNAGFGLHQTASGTSVANQQTMGVAELELQGELVLNLAIGDIVLVTGTASARCDVAFSTFNVDLQVVQPSAAKVTLSTVGVGDDDVGGNSRMTSGNVGIFTALENGAHTFQQTVQRIGGGGEWDSLGSCPMNTRAASFRVLT